VSYRYRRQRLTGGQVAAIAVAAAVLLSGAAGARAVPAHRGHATGDVAAVGHSRQWWAAALLRSGGFPLTRCNLAAITAWERAEGGHWENGAERNPLNDARWMPGSWLMPGYNRAHVRAYPTWGSGLQATLATLAGPDYGSIRGALDNGNDAQAVATAVAPVPVGDQLLLSEVLTMSRRLSYWAVIRPSGTPLCPTCKGSGVQPRSRPKSICRSCRGWGY
jgi:hypothetical protein